MSASGIHFTNDGRRLPAPHAPAPDLPGPGDFHLRVRAEAENTVHSRQIAGLMVALLLLLTGAYALFVWQSDRSTTRLQQPVAAYDTPQPVR